MDSLDLHPEALFDKLAQGVATEVERARAEAHLASCATCRFEHTVRADFAAVGTTDADVDDLVARALMGALTPVAPPLRRRRVNASLVAAVALMGFASFAAVTRFFSPSPAGERESRATPLEQPQPKPKQSPPLPPPPLPNPTIAPRPRKAPVALTIAPTAPPPLDDTPAIPRETALSLFLEAQHARMRGDDATAIGAFRSITARYPQAREASLANAALGRLLLERNEPRSALEVFDAYLASGDLTLKEDVLAERATVLEALDRTDEARAAWQDVIREDPHGVHAPHARERLDATSH